MDLQLVGKRAVVTGSSSGIGEAIAKAMAAEGASVVVHGRREAEAKRVAAEIKAAGGKAVVALGDLSTDAGADAVAKVADQAFGGADILINNAGAFPHVPWLESTAEQWTELYNQNVGSMVRLITRLVPGMKQRGLGPGDLDRQRRRDDAVRLIGQLLGHQGGEHQPRGQPGQGPGRHGHHVQCREPGDDRHSRRRGASQGFGPAVRTPVRRPGRDQGIRA